MSKQDPSEDDTSGFIRRLAIPALVILALSIGSAIAFRTPLDRATSPAAPGGLVTANQFAAWLIAHPDWAPAEAKSSVNAGSTYNIGLDGGTPSAGAHAMVNVPWRAAAAYCEAHGGLLGLHDPALTWTESGTQPWYEHRSAGGRPAWRRGDGEASTEVTPGESGASLGFRCVR